MNELNGFKVDFEMPANYSLILVAVSAVINVYAPATRSPVLFGQYSDTRISEMEHNDIIEAILVRVSTQVTVRVLLEADTSYRDFAQKILGLGNDLDDSEYFYRVFHKKDKAIWFVDSLRSFKRLKADLLNKRLHYNRNGFFCIIYTGRELGRFNIIRTFFQELFAIFVINVNILVVSKETVHIYTYFPYTPQKCGSTKPWLYDIFGPSTNYTLKQRKFFSKKLLNMWGCKVRVTTWDEPPFTMVKYYEHNGEFDRLEGIEGKLIMLLAERMNFTVQIAEEPNHNRGTHYPNGTATGSTKMLIDGETDIVVICLKYDLERTEISTPAYTYLSVPLNLAIPKGHLMTPFERLFRPFKYIIWSCFTFSIVFGILVIFSLKAVCNAKVQEFVFGHGNRIPLTTFWNVFYGGSIASPLPRRNFARYLLGIWILYSWLLRTAYTGQLFIILQDSRGRTTLNTIEEVVKRNYTFYTYPILLPSLEGSTLSKLNVEFIDTDKNSLSNLFTHLGEDENANAAITVLGHIIRAYNQNPKNLKRHVNILREPLFSTPLTFYMQKNSFLAFEIDELLLNIMSAGLIKRFEDLYLNRDFMTSNQHSTSISLWLLLGIFSIYICFLALSTLVFLLELWSKHSPLTKGVIDFFNL